MTLTWSDDPLPWQSVRELPLETDDLELWILVTLVQDHLMRHRAMSVDDWNGMCSRAHDRFEAKRRANEAKHRA